MCGNLMCSTKRLFFSFHFILFECGKGTRGKKNKNVTGAVCRCLLFDYTEPEIVQCSDKTKMSATETKIQTRKTVELKTKLKRIKKNWSKSKSKSKMIKYKYHDNTDKGNDIPIPKWIFRIHRVMMNLKLRFFLLFLLLLVLFSLVEVSTVRTVPQKI